MTLIENKKARFDYEVLTEFEAGIELLGHEVKSLRDKQGKLEGSHVIIRGGSPHSAGPRHGRWEAYLVGMHIPPYQPKNTDKEYDPERSRTLLLTKKELSELAGLEGQRGLTIVPLRVYTKGRNLKMTVAAVRGRKKYDKRALLKERTAKREIDRTLKGT